MEIKVDREFIQKVLIQLVQTDSRNPSMVADAPGEENIGSIFADLIKEMGLKVTTFTLAPGRVNVVGVLPGTGNGRSLILNGHLDTVGVDEMKDPFSGKVKEGRLYGRGSQDMKGSLAAMLGSIKSLVDGGVTLGGDLIITAVADEENQSLGTIELVKSLKADAAIVTEPTDLQVVSAHRGWIWYQVEVEGKAAHGSRFQDGKDAILLMGRFLVELEKLSSELVLRSGHPLTGPPSIHTSLIKGGSDMCTYPSRCTVSIERRTVSGESENQVTQEIQEIVNHLNEEDLSFIAKLNLIAERSPLDTDSNSGIMRALKEAYQNQQGKPAQVTGAAYWTDAALLAEAGMDSVLIGPSGEGLHSAEEWVELESVYDLAEILAATAILYCK